MERTGRATAVGTGSVREGMVERSAVTAGIVGFLVVEIVAYASI